MKAHCALLKLSCVLLQSLWSITVHFQHNTVHFLNIITVNLLNISAQFLNIITNFLNSCAPLDTSTTKFDFSISRQILILIVFTKLSAQCTSEKHNRNFRSVQCDTKEVRSSLCQMCAPILKKWPLMFYFRTKQKVKSAHLSLRRTH